MSSIAANRELDGFIRDGISTDYENSQGRDLLKKDWMTAEETQKVKLAAKSLLERLLSTQPKVLVQDWYKNDQSQRQVKFTVESILDKI